MSRKVLAVNENNFSESIMKLNQFADVLVFKKVKIMYHKTTLMGKKGEKKFEILENF